VEWMHKVVTHHDDEAYLTKLAAEVSDYCQKFPLPSDRA
jgi:glycine/serine hydroxymethyltransferase